MSETQTESPTDDAETLADKLEDADAPPPSEATAEDTPTRIPFFDVGASGADGVVQVRAGWLTADGETDALAISATVGIEQAQPAMTLALSWYRIQLRALLGSTGGEQQE